MKILVISDSHGHIANLKHIMEFGKKIKVGAVIHCGDWDDLESVNTVLSFGIPLYSVLGNADVEPEIEESLRFNAKMFNDQWLMVNIDGRKIGITHKLTISNQPLAIGRDIVFSGHYHSKEEKMINFTKFVRPGALINGINFAIYETINGGVEFINEQI